MSATRFCNIHIAILEKIEFQEFQEFIIISKHNITQTPINTNVQYIFLCDFYKTLFERSLKLCFVNSNKSCIFAAVNKGDAAHLHNTQSLNDMNTTIQHGTTANQFVAYYRVSTRKQGLGLDAQQTTVQEYIKNHGGNCIAEYSEKESGKGSNVKNRTALWNAIDECKRTGATLILAKLDRLARDVVFTMSICNSGINIVFCDLPQINTMVLGIFATVAQYERELCSDRTRKALAERKRQGVALGANNGASHVYTDTNRQQAYAAHTKAAAENENSRKAWHFISTKYNRRGVTLQRLADQLNAEHYLTPTGRGQWRGNMVARLIERYGKK